MSDKLEIENLLSAHEEAPEEEVSDMLGVIGKALENLEEVIKKQHFAIHHHEERISLLEKYISYLLSKDPEMKDKMKAMAEAHDKTKE